MAGKLALVERPWLALPRQIGLTPPQMVLPATVAKREAGANPALCPQL